MPAYQGNFLSIKTDVKQKLRLSDDDDAILGTWVNLAYVDAVQRTEAIQATALTDLTAGVNSYAMPSGLLLTKRLQRLYPDGSTSYPNRLVSLDYMLRMRQGTPASGQWVTWPIYTEVGQNQIEIWPDPGTGEKLRFWYVVTPEMLVNDDDAPVLIEPFGSQLLSYGACVEAAKFKKDPLLQDFESYYSYWIDRYQAFFNRRHPIGQFALYLDEWPDYVVHDRATVPW